MLTHDWLSIVVTSSQLTTKYFDCCMNIYDFNCNENNVMHKLYNFPTSTIALVFFWNVLHLQKLKQQFHYFKVNHSKTLLQKPKNCNKLYKLHFSLPNYIPHNNHVNHCVISPTIEKPLILCVMWLSKQVILPHVVIWFCNLAFTPRWKHTTRGATLGTFITFM
jgi:hypothetical protein